MRLVTFTSFKGGAGKSTALMAAVPGLLQAAGKGYRSADLAVG